MCRGFIKLNLALAVAQMNLLYNSEAVASYCRTHNDMPTYDSYNQE